MQSKGFQTFPQKASKPNPWSVMCWNVQLTILHVSYYSIIPKRLVFVTSNPGQQYRKGKMAHEGGGKISHIHWEHTLGRPHVVYRITMRHHRPVTTIDMAKYLTSCQRCQTMESVKFQKNLIMSYILYLYPILHLIKYMESDWYRY